MPVDRSTILPLYFSLAGLSGGGKTTDFFLACQTVTVRDYAYLGLTILLLLNLTESFAQ